MEKNKIESRFIKFLKALPDWPKEGIKKYTVDSIAETSKKIVEWFIVINAGPLIAASFIGIFTALLIWLKTPITIPAFIIPIAMILFLIGGWSVKKLKYKLPLLIKKRNEQELFKFIWKVGLTTFDGPFCPKADCHAEMMHPEYDMDEQAAMIAERYLGIYNEHICSYRCSACGQIIKSDFSYVDLLEMVEKATGKKKAEEIVE